MVTLITADIQKTKVNIGRILNIFKLWKVSNKPSIIILKYCQDLGLDYLKNTIY